jgi:hypothetical protein
VHPAGSRQSISGDDAFDNQGYKPFDQRARHRVSTVRRNSHIVEPQTLRVDTPGAGQTLSASARLAANTTYWGLLKQPDKQKSPSGDRSPAFGATA